MGNLPCKKAKTANKSVQIPSATMRAISMDTLDQSQTEFVPPRGQIQIPITKPEEVNAGIFDQIVKEVDFSSIVNAHVQIEKSEEDSSAIRILSSKKTQLKQPHNSGWNERYYAHGDLSSVVTEVDNQTHGCINSSVSEEIDVYLAELNKISIQADDCIQNRIKVISSMEEAILKQLIEEREKLMKIILKNGSFRIEDYEKYYRSLIEKYIEQLEIEMSERLDILYKDLDGEKTQIFTRSRNSIKDLTIKVQDAKREVVEHIHRWAKKEIERILITSGDYTKNKLLPLGYEKLTKINLQIYSTVGNNEDGQACDNIPDRDKYVNNIKDAKPHQPIKRTVYLGSNLQQ